MKAQLLWVKLMDQFNQNYWPETLEIAPGVLSAGLHATRPATLSEARNELQKLGLIEYNKKTRVYKINPIVRDNDGLHPSGQAHIEPETESIQPENKPVQEQIELVQETKTVKKPAPKSKPKAPPLPYDDILALWNTHHGEMPSIKSITKNRKAQLRRLIKEGNTLDDIKRAVLKAEQSDFLNGRIKDWRADFDWIMKTNNFVKVLEGNYDNHTAPHEMTADEYLTAGGAGLIDIDGSPIEQGFEDYVIADDEFIIDDPEVIAWIEESEG